MKKIVSVLVIIAMAAAMLVGCGDKEDMTATTMRVLSYEGEVSLVEEDGSSSALMENIKLHSGNILETKDAATAQVGMDDTKIVTLQEKSKAQFLQDGNALKLDLQVGEVMFNVTKKLDSNESFEVSTSTSICGIRGTIGYVTEDADGNETFCIVEGEVTITTTNPTNGFVVSETLSAGEKAKIVHFLNDSVIDKGKVTIDDLPEGLVLLLSKDKSLMERVEAATGITEEEISKKATEIIENQQSQSETEDGQAIDDNANPEDNGDGTEANGDALTNTDADQGGTSNNTNNDGTSYNNDSSNNNSSSNTNNNDSSSDNNSSDKNNSSKDNKDKDSKDNKDSKDDKDSGDDKDDKDKDDKDDKDDEEDKDKEEETVKVSKSFDIDLAQSSGDSKEILASEVNSEGKKEVVEKISLNGTFEGYYVKIEGEVNENFEGCVVKYGENSLNINTAKGVNWQFDIDDGLKSVSSKDDADVSVAIGSSTMYFAIPTATREYSMTFGSSGSFDIPDKENESGKTVRIEKVTINCTLDQYAITLTGTADRTYKGSSVSYSGKTLDVGSTDGIKWSIAESSELTMVSSESEADANVVVGSTRYHYALPKEEEEPVYYPPSDPGTSDTITGTDESGNAYSYDPSTGKLVITGGEDGQGEFTCVLRPSWESEPDEEPIYPSIINFSGESLLLDGSDEGFEGTTINVSNTESVMMDGSFIEVTLNGSSSHVSFDGSCSNSDITAESFYACTGSSLSNCTLNVNSLGGEFKNCSVDLSNCTDVVFEDGISISGGSWTVTEETARSLLASNGPLHDYYIEPPQTPDQGGTWEDVDTVTINGTQYHKYELNQSGSGGGQP